jgi:hypothetical protein
VTRAVELARAFHDHGAPVVLVRVTARADGSDAAPGRNEIQSRPGSLPEGWDVIVDDRAGHPDDITVTPAILAALLAGQVGDAGFELARDVLGQRHRPEMTRLWDHQQRAVTAASDALAAGDRATVVSACGTGKTLVAVVAARRLAGRDRTLVLVPTVDLVLDSPECRA